MPVRSLLLAALFGLLLAAPTSAKDADPWRADYEAARDEAIKASKPLLLYVLDDT
jgi:hypothetical protein